MTPTTLPPSVRRLDTAVYAICTDENPEQQQSALMLPSQPSQLLVRQRDDVVERDPWAPGGARYHLGEGPPQWHGGAARDHCSTRRMIASERWCLLSLVVLARQYVAITTEIGALEKQIHAWHRSCEESRRLEEIPGVGPIVATALVAEVGDWKAFSSGRSLAAWIGLVPSVLILKFLCSCFMIADCSAAEASDRSEDVVGRFYPSERFWIGVTDLDIGVDRCFQLGRRSMHAPFDLLL